MLQKNGLWWWRLKFNPSFKFFLNKKEIQKYNKVAHERIVTFLQKVFNQRLNEVQSEIVKS